MSKIVRVICHGTEWGGGKMMENLFLSAENRETEQIDLQCLSCGLYRLMEDENKKLCKESEMVKLYV